MKKLVLVLMVLLSCFTFTGCKNNDEEYINKIKSISFQGDKLLFAENVEDLAKNICILWQFGGPVNKKDLKWKIEKINKAEREKIVKCEYLGNNIYFLTYYDDKSGCGVNLSRSYTVSQMGWQSSMTEILRCDYQAIEHYFK